MKRHVKLFPGRRKYTYIYTGTFVEIKFCVYIFFLFFSKVSHEKKKKKKKRGKRKNLEACTTHQSADPAATPIATHPRRSPCPRLADIKTIATQPP
jgi:hypothetical protein